MGDGHENQAENDCGMSGSCQLALVAKKCCCLDQMWIRPHPVDRRDIVRSCVGEANGYSPHRNPES